MKPGLHRQSVPEAVMREILEAGVQAPSGGNSQPWRFELRGDALAVWMLAEKDHPILNFRRRGTLLAHGMLIESLALATRHHGYRPIIDLLPDNDQPALSALIRFEADAGEVSDSDLHAAIRSRCTNRKPYRRDPLAPALVEALADASGRDADNGIELAFVPDRPAIERLAQAASTSEWVMFENRTLHRLFFQELVWSAADARRRKAGLQIGTVEMQPAQRIALRLFRHFPSMRLLNHFGMARSIARNNARAYANCALYAAVGCGTRDVDLIRAGRVILRLWLKATSQGLSLHLQTGISFLWQGAAGGNGGELSPHHVARIDAAYEVIRTTTALDSDLIPALCRIGYGGEPSARSTKQDPEVRCAAASGKASWEK